MVLLTNEVCVAFTLKKVSFHYKQYQHLPDDWCNAGHYPEKRIGKIPNPGKPQGSPAFLKADDNILFFLNKDRNLMVGNADFSYTLNRVKK